MITRQIKPEEVRRTEELFSISFDYPYENKLDPEALYDKYIREPESREQEFCLERFASFEDDDHTMMSCFLTQPFQIRFDGQNESMYSIGGVATLPQYRKRGGIRSCFETALPYLYKKGAVFSYLYPFSTAYYRKFGYEICMKRQIVKISLPFIPSFSIDGSCYLLDSSTADHALKDIPLIYKNWQEKYNMMVEGISYDFRFISQADPYKDQEFTYVYRSAENKPLAYMTFRNHTSPDQRFIQCSRFFYVNEEGLKGLLSLAKTFASDYRYIEFPLPEGFALEQLIPEWSMGAVECSLQPYGMVRVINVSQVLKDAAYLGSGSLSIKIHDPYIEANDRTFHIEFSNGRCTALATDNGSCDICMPVSSFSALIAGGYETSSVPYFNGVKIYDLQAPLEKIFYRKPVYITSYF